MLNYRFIWCVEVLNYLKNVNLSPVLVAILAASITLSLSEVVRGETQASTEQRSSSQGEQLYTELLKNENPHLSPLGQEIVVELLNEAQTEATEAQLAQNQQPESSARGQEIVVELVNEAQTEATEAQLAQNQPRETLPFPAGQEEDTMTPAQEPRVLVAEVVVSGAGVEGAELDLEDLVYNTIRTYPGRTTTRSQLQEDVNAIYATGFFANVTVIPEDTALGVRVTFAVEPNPVLSKVVIEIVPDVEENRVLPTEVIDDIFSEQYGKILNLRELQEDIKDLNKWYADNGYDLAQVVGAPAVAENGTVTLIVAEGIIEDIQVRFFDDEDEPVEGRTRDFIVAREVELKPGDVFNRNTAQKDLQRVFGLGLFEDARLSFSPGEDPTKVVVNVDVVEGNTGSLAAGAGISSASGLFGTASYQQQNLGGNNQTIATEIQVGTRELLFDASFTDPWIAGDPYRTSYTVNGFRRRSISLIYSGDDTDDIETEDGNDRPRIVRTGGGVTFSRPLPANPYAKPNWRLSAGLQYQHVQIQNSDGDISPRSREADGNRNLAFSDDGEDDLVMFKFGASRDRRNNSLQPTSGSVMRLGMDQTVPVGSGSILMSRVRGSYSFYLPVNYLKFSDGPQAFAFNFQAGTVLGDLPPYEAFAIGGSNSVRGYGEGDLGNGRSYFQASAEYRFPILNAVGGALFVDYGTDLGSGSAVPGNPSGVRDLPGSGLGYGLGVRIQSPLGPIRIDYGLNDQGDSRLHFGIGERF
ncbi:MAG: BamA/TamA family outer membrane protein [Moorea sp. SIO2B7]|nr:BamA/TamA family outer membrane protein [Moorena sp. SIO2B7]